MPLPTIAIVTPSYNQAPFLERTIRSVIEQDYPDLEYAVLDGGSTDGSAKIIERYADRMTYSRSGPDDGQSAAINEGWRRSTGEILGWINSDDYYLPGAFAFVGTYFEEHPETALVYGLALVVDGDGLQLGMVGEPFDQGRMLHGSNPMPQPSTFIRRRLLSEVGHLDESLHYAMDLDLFIRASQRTEPAFVPEPLSAVTFHSEAKTFAARAAARQEAFAVCNRYVTGFGRLEVGARSLLSHAFHRLPARLRRYIDAHRPSPFQSR